MTEDSELDNKSLKALMKVYLREPDNLKYEIDMRIGLVAEEFGAADCHIFDEKALDLTVGHFQSNCLPYWKQLGVDEPSHLKIFGFLLHSLTQVRDGEGFRSPIVYIDEIDVTDLPFTSSEQSEGDNTAHYLAEHFHEFACFSTVYQMLVSAQRQRREPLRFDVTKPPSSRRFTRSMVDYLREVPDGHLAYDKKPFDFYMIFKAMDLYGVDAAS